MNLARQVRAAAQDSEVAASRRIHGDHHGIEYLYEHFLKWWYPLHHPFSLCFPWKTIHFGVSHFWNPPYSIMPTWISNPLGSSQGINQGLPCGGDYESETCHYWVKLGWAILLFFNISNGFGHHFWKAPVMCLEQCHYGPSSSWETQKMDDWSGSGNQRSTSSAVHVLNGLVIHSSSRT